MKLLTIGDFYRQRFDQLVEMLVSLTICCELPWIDVNTDSSTSSRLVKLIFNDWRDEIVG